MTSVRLRCFSHVPTRRIITSVIFYSPCWKDRLVELRYDTYFEGLPGYLRDDGSIKTVEKKSSIDERLIG